MARGRPREFDRNAALGQAMELFWRRGYQDTSIADLTERLGVSSPSLYAAFGSKAALFCEAADRYQAEEGARPGREMEEAPTARIGVERLLRANVDIFTRRGGPRGCLLTRATLSCPPADEVVRRYLGRSRRERMHAIEARLRRAERAGEALPTDDVVTLAAHHDALVQGLAVRGIEGASRPALHRSVDLAMASWDALVSVIGRPPAPSGA